MERVANCGMASNQWNSNPSFQSSSGFREDRLPVRTVDNCLAELAKKAIAQGLIPEPHTFSPVNVLFEWN